MTRVLVLALAFFLAGCQTNQAVHPTDLMRSQADLVRQELELTPPLDMAPHCDAHAEVEKLLEQKYKEQPLLAGGYLDGSVMQLYVGPNGAWSLSREVGPVTCILAAGYGLQIIDPPTKPAVSKKEI
tara:strand:- start:1660 stop:2040 length:381 start_codon:yes stop_codon:yes gene_type:complete